MQCLNEYCNLYCLIFNLSIFNIFVTSFIILLYFIHNLAVIGGIVSTSPILPTLLILFPHLYFFLLSFGVYFHFIMILNLITNYVPIFIILLPKYTFSASYISPWLSFFAIYIDSYWFPSVRFEYSFSTSLIQIFLFIDLCVPPYTLFLLHT